MADSRIRVLFVIPNLQQGGAERQILQLMRRLPPRFESALCLFEDVCHYRELLPDGEPRHVLGVTKMDGVGLDRLVKVLGQARPHIVHSFRDLANHWLCRAVSRAPVPVVLTHVRNRRLAPLNLATDWYLSRRCDRVLINSEGIRGELVHLARVDPKRIRVIPNVVDVDAFHPPNRPEREAARERWGLGADHIALLLPGRLSLQKHQLGLVRAIAKLASRGQLPSSVRVLLAGRAHSPVYTRLVSWLVAHYGLQNTIRQLGSVPAADMPALYHASDALVMPSLWEGLPNGVLEAHLSGLPAVVSHAANVDQLVLDGHSGFEVATLRGPALAAAIHRMIELGPDGRCDMGARGRAHIVERFAPERVVGELVALYESLLREKGVPEAGTARAEPPR